MARDDDEIEEQEAGGAAFWSAVVVLGAALFVAGRFGYLDASLDLFLVTITTELAGAVLFVIGSVMVAVFLIGEE